MRLNSNDMKLVEQIETHIANGMNQACEDMFLFCENESIEFTAEYLLTVNVAKELAKKLNQPTVSNYKIYLERNTRKIATECVPLYSTMGRDYIHRRQPLYAGFHNTERKGRCDIALYSNKGGNYVPCCIIEVKGFNPIKKNVFEDLKRNSEFFGFSTQTGESHVECTCFASIHSFPRSFSAEEYARDLKGLKDKYEKWNKSVSLPKDVKSKIKIWTVSSCVETQCHLEGDQITCSLDDNHHFAGTIVSYYKDTGS
jgi:hypothetical protein